MVESIFRRSESIRYVAIFEQYKRALSLTSSFTPPVAAARKLVSWPGCAEQLPTFESSVLR